jgi:hypothetical protein
LNDVELVDFAVSRKERLTIHELTHDAANRPDVDFFTVWKILRNQ